MCRVYGPADGSQLLFLRCALCFWRRTGSRCRPSEVLLLLLLMFIYHEEWKRREKESETLIREESKLKRDGVFWLYVRAQAAFDEN